MYHPNVFAHHGRLTYLIQCNPCTALLELLRQPLLAGEYPNPVYFVEAGALLLALGGLAWFLLRRFEKTLVYWI
jgi:ABC-type polysaccharide/polyol phosphate export permease